MSFVATLHASVTEIGRADWERCLPAEAEGWDYYKACESCLPDRAHPVAVSVSRGETVIAVAPIFYLEHRVDSSLHGHARAATNMLNRVWPGLLVMRVIGLGSAYAERCHIGFAPELAVAERNEALAAMLQTLERYGAKAGIPLTVMKDLVAHDAHALQGALDRMGYAQLQSLPLAVLELPPTADDYLARLSRATRKDVRRKLRKAAEVEIETVEDTHSIAADMQRLYRMTQLRSNLDYGDLEELPPGYFEALSEVPRGRLAVKLYRAGGKLMAFNLLFFNRDRVIDKFIGIDYELARDYDVYVLSWMENVREALSRKARYLQTGQTAYRRKIQLGSTLAPCVVYFRHQSQPTQALLRLLARWLAFDRNDPELRDYVARPVGASA
jgi:predicted N-acyltransferase